MIEMLAMGVVLAAVVILRERQIAQERDKWMRERQILLNRIQHPERPVITPERRPIQRREPRDIAALRQIGTIQPQRSDDAG